MVKFSDVQEEDYDSKSYRGFKRYKQYKQKINEQEIPPNTYIEQKYFTCLGCGKINLVEDVVKEESENRTMRAKYSTWNKFKSISNDVGGDMENGMLYLMSLHEGIIPMKSGRIPEEREINVARGNDEERQKLIDENLKRLGINNKKK